MLDRIRSKRKSGNSFGFGNDGGKKTGERQEEKENTSGFSEGRSMAIFHSLSSARINMH